MNNAEPLFTTLRHKHLKKKTTTKKHAHTTYNNMLYYQSTLRDL